MTAKNLQLIASSCGEPWEEEWRPVPGFDGRYDVSALGRFRSWALHGSNNKGRAKAPRVLRTCISKRGGGYRIVSLTKIGAKIRKYRCAPLVLKAFVGPWRPGLQASHLNGVPSDDRLANLLWESPRDNSRRKRAHGTQPLGEGAYNSKLVGWQVEEIRYLRSRGITKKRIAACLGISYSAVHGVLYSGKWPHITGPRTPPPALAAEVLRLREENVRLRVALKTLRSLRRGEEQ